MSSHGNKNHGKKDDDPTHDEIWDDSALIDSWNEALAEYKKYHSIHLQGGRVEDLSDHGASLQEATPQSDSAPTETNGEQGGHAEVAVDGVADDGHSARISNDAPAPPHIILGSVRDEGLKKLLMSWYYAGYYTGLYEGQQQQQQQN